MTVNRELRRKQLLTSFLNTFATHGLDKTTMCDLITESGISSSFIYEMFEGRDQMVIESTRYYYASLAESLQTLTMDPNLSLKDVLDNIEELTVSNLSQDRFALQVLLHPIYRPKCEDVVEMLKQHQYRTNIMLAEKAGVEAEDAQIITSYMHSAINAFAIMADEKLFRTQMERIRKYWRRCEQGDLRKPTWEK